MKITKYLLLILIILMTVVSCSSNINEEATLSDDLLYFEPPEGLKPDKINVMNIFKKHKSGETEREITLHKKDQIIMDDLIEELSGIKLKKLNEREKNKLFEEKEAIYEINLRDTTNNRKKSGFGRIPDKITNEIYIFSTGEIVFVGPETVGDIIPKQPYYINSEDISDKVESIISLIEYAYSSEYDNVNRLVMKTSTNSVTITDKEKLQYYKEILNPGDILENQNIDKSIDEKILEIEFYINGEVLFIEEIYSLKEYTTVTDYFMINDSKYVAKVDKLYRKLHIQDSEIFSKIF